MLGIEGVGIGAHLGGGSQIPVRPLELGGDAAVCFKDLLGLFV